MPDSSLPHSEFQLTQSVRFVDTDQHGVAHFATYVRMMEETEYAFLRSRGLSVVLYDERGTLGFPRLQARLNVKQPLVFDDQVRVMLRLSKIDGKQITYEFDLVNDSGFIAVDGEFEVACCRFPDGKPPFAVLIPDYVTTALTSQPSERQTSS